MEYDEGGCCFVEDGGQCDQPAVITVKQSAPPPYDQTMMCAMKLCAEHYDILFPNGEENLFV